jgi:hypothetical protein
VIFEHLGAQRVRELEALRVLEFERERSAAEEFARLEAKRAAEWERRLAKEERTNELQKLKLVRMEINERELSKNNREKRQQALVSKTRDWRLQSLGTRSKSTPVQSLPCRFEQLVKAEQGDKRELEEFGFQSCPDLDEPIAVDEFFESSFDCQRRNKLKHPPRHCSCSCDSVA